MLNEQTFDKLYALKLTGMAEALKDQMGRADMDGLVFEERFSMLVDPNISEGKQEDETALRTRS
jgi:hypothetical protein